MNHLQRALLRALLAIILIASAAPPVRSADDLRAEILTSRDGLGNNTVRHIMQDSKGYMWFCTLGGITRYDGYRFVNYSRNIDDEITLTDQAVRSSAEGPGGLIWVHGANDHVSCLDPATGRFLDFTGTGDYQHLYRYMRILGQQVWIWGEYGALCVVYDKGKFHSQAFSLADGNLDDDRVIAVAADHNGHVWLSTAKSIYSIEGDKAVERLPGQSFQWLSTDPAAHTSAFVCTDGKVFTIKGKSTSPTLAATVPGIHGLTDLPGQLVARHNLYIFTSGPAYRLDLRTGTLSRAESELNLLGGQVFTDEMGDHWVHNNSGRLVLVESESGKVENLDIFPARMSHLLDMERIAISRDRQGRAWITTNGNGLFSFDLASRKARHFTEEDSIGGIIPSNELLNVRVDRDGTIWVGSDGTGASRVETPADLSALSLPGIPPATTAPANNYRLVKRLPGGDILIGNRSGDLYRYAANLDTLRWHKSYTSVVYDATEDSRGQLWLATRGGGIYVDDRNYAPGNSSTDLPHRSVFVLREDRKGRMWIGTMGGGLALAERAADGGYTFRRFFNDTYGRRRIRDIFLDPQGRLWIGSNDGLIVLDPDEFIADQSKYHIYNIEHRNYRGDWVHCIAQGPDGSVWIGGNGIGVAICRDPSKPDDLQFEYIDADHGLANNTVLAMTPLGDEMMVSTEYGASRVAADGTVVENYVLSSNSKANIYNSHALVSLGDTAMLIGSHGGLFEFDPFDTQSDKATLPTVEFTGMRVNGEQRLIEADTAAPGEIPTLRLPHNQNNFEIDFSSLEFSTVNPSSYSYRLEPYDHDWSQPSRLNYASYKNMAPGSYTLRVRAARKDGQWGPEASLRIIVEAPWYATWWARTVFALLALAAGIVIFLVLKRIESLRNRVKVEEQLTDYKLEFFTNISHEFRTPLTLMQVSLEKIHEVLGRDTNRDARRNLSGHLTTLDRNSRRMMRLINELLTFRKVEKNKLTLHPEPTEVVGFVSEIFDSFKDEAQQKQLTFTIDRAIPALTIDVDRDSLDKIVHNLLSNAVKYTLQGGAVNFRVSVDDASRRFVLQVRDNGIGIPADKKSQLFSRFMQSNFSQKSIGVGLHLTFGLVQLYGGSIRHDDNPGGGSIFTVEIPTDLEADEKFMEQKAVENQAPSKADETAVEEYATTAPAPETGLKLLIIDDDADIREALSREFGQYFEVITAADGTSGLKAARENDVALIICDVMMPDMSGFEVTRRLKDDFATSHIPIIQLTALSNDESHIRGIETGADAYITKPFSLQFLKARAFKLIELRRVLQAKFSQSPSMPESELPLVSQDREFLERLNEVATREMGNSEFSADDFASALNMGRTIFFKKVKGVTGYGPKEYLRIMRMKKGAELLLTTDLNISEIAYKVGMSDPAYFNRCFKAQFGKAPSLYQREHRQ